MMSQSIHKSITCMDLCNEEAVILSPREVCATCRISIIPSDWYMSSDDRLIGFYEMSRYYFCGMECLWNGTYGIKRGFISSKSDRQILNAKKYRRILLSIKRSREVKINGERFQIRKELDFICQPPPSPTKFKVSTRIIPLRSNAKSSRPKYTKADWMNACKQLREIKFQMGTVITVSH